MFFRSWQNAYTKFPKCTQFYHYTLENSNESQDNESLEEFCERISKNGAGATLVIDDGLQLCEKNQNKTDELFTRISHHLGVSIFMLVQNLFDPALRVISRNVGYIFLFQSPRDASQIRHLSYQIFPEKNKARSMLEIFRIITQKPYRAILLDFKAETPSFARLKGNFIGKESATIYCVNGEKPPLEAINSTQI